MFPQSFDTVLTLVFYHLQDRSNNEYYSCVKKGNLEIPGQ